MSPRLIVALGATAAQGLTGRAIRVQSSRGAVLNAANGSRVFITIHPSALLRLHDEEEKRAGYASFVSDLRAIGQLIETPTEEARSGVRAIE